MSDEERKDEETAEASADTADESADLGEGDEE